MQTLSAALQKCFRAKRKSPRQNAGFEYGGVLSGERLTVIGLG